MWFDCIYFYINLELLLKHAFSEMCFLFFNHDFDHLAVSGNNDLGVPSFIMSIREDYPLW
jgi:hypothetical protein